MTTAGISHARLRESEPNEQKPLPDPAHAPLDPTMHFVIGEWEKIVEYSDSQVALAQKTCNFAVALFRAVLPDFHARLAKRDNGGHSAVTP